MYYTKNAKDTHPELMENVLGCPSKQTNTEKKETFNEEKIDAKLELKDTFYKEDGTPYKNARNMMAGLKNSDTISDDLQYVHHVRYGFASEDFTLNKSEQLDFISKNISKPSFFASRSIS